MTKSMNPDNASIHGPFVRVDRIIDGNFAGHSSGKIFGGDPGGSFIALTHVFGPFFQRIAQIQSQRFAEYPRSPFGGIIPSRAIQRHMPVPGLSQIERAVREEIGSLEFILAFLQFLFSSLALCNIGKTHDCTKNFTLVEDRCRAVFDGESNAILAPKKFVIHVTCLSPLASCAHGTLLNGVDAAISPMVMDQWMGELAN